MSDIREVWKYWPLKDGFRLIPLFSHKMVFVENETALLCVTMRERAMAFAATI